MNRYILKELLSLSPDVGPTQFIQKKEVNMAKKKHKVKKIKHKKLKIKKSKHSKVKKHSRGASKKSKKNKVKKLIAFLRSHKKKRR